MIQYRVGEKFPLKNYVDRGEITVAVVNDVLFDIVVSLGGITAEEKKAFRKGPVTLSLFRYKDVPFIVVDFGKGFSFNVSINVTKLTEEQQAQWFNEPGNIVNLFLINAHTGVLEAMRTFGINFAEELKDICEVQSEHTPAYVQNIIEQALDLLETSMMAYNAVKKISFK